MAAQPDALNGVRLHVSFVEPVGGHRGMHYYDVELCQGLQATGLDLTWLTCDETAQTEIPASLKVAFPFRGIYGDALKPLRGLRYLRGLMRIGGGLRPRAGNLFHFHYFLFPPLDYAYLRGLRAAGRRIVLTAHDVVPFDARRGDLIWLRRLYHLADQIIVHANSNREVMLQTFGVDSDKVHVIPMGPYLQWASQHSLPSATARGYLGLDPDRPVLLFFGQIKRVKGLQHLIRAFRLVADEHPTVQLVIAGPEWKEPFAEYAALIEQLGLSDRVRTRIEYVSDEELSWYYSAADVVALPYTEVYQSAVLYMAYSFERPVIASAVGGLVEVVKDGETGLLVPPADPPALAAALLRLLRDLDLARQMGRQGKHLVETEFSWSAIAGRTIEVYARALAARRRP